MSSQIITDYFNFLRTDDIRLAGTRIGIETILYDYLERSRTPEEIAQTYTSLTLRTSLRHNSLLPAKSRRNRRIPEKLARTRSQNERATKTQPATGFRKTAATESRKES